MARSVNPTENLHGDRPSAGSEQGLVDRKELAAVAFQRTRMPMVVTDARAINTPIVLANDAFLQLSGYSAEEVIGRNCRMLQGALTSPKTVEKIRLGLNNGREINVDILNYRKDGSTFWNRLYISPIRDDDGRIIYFFASQMDVTELRKVQALETTERHLLMEVEHRSNNVLAIVESIVRHSDASEPAAYARAIQRRVQAISAVHRLFAERRWRNVPLDEVAKQQVAPFAVHRGSFDGPVIKLPPTVLQPLGLVFHELASNAARHGALTTEHGALRVAWSSDRGNLSIDWSEIGRPSRAETKSGFGTVIIDTLVKQQLNGKIHREWRSDGLTVAITVPSLTAASP